MRANPNDILIWTMVRKVLTEYAQMISQLNDTFEAGRLRETLIAELQAIVPGAIFPPIWWQATRAVVEDREKRLKDGGPTAYAMDRLGLWPKDKDDTDK